MNFSKIIVSSITCLVISLTAGMAFAEGDIIYTQPVMGVIFSHEVHVEEYGMDCDTCHDGLFDMEALNAQENSDFTMKGLAEGKYCGACHDGDMAFDSDTRCASCHIGVIGYRRATGTAVSSEHH